MKSFRDRNPYAVGIVSLLVIGAVVGAAFLVGTLRLLEDTYAVDAVFTDAAGLRTGDDVKVAGVDVGRVASVSADREHGLVRVTLEIDSGVEIRDDAGADIALETLLGSKYVRIVDPTAGDRAFADLPRDERVITHERCRPDGTCTPRTTTPVDVFDLTREATERIDATDNDKLNELIAQLSEISEGQRGTVTDLIEGVDRVSTAINERETELVRLLESADQLAADLAEKDQTLVRLIDASRTILDFLVERRSELAAALGEGNAAVQSLSELISTNQETLDEVLADLHPTLAVVDRNLPELNRALAVLGPAFYGQALAGSHGPWLDIYVASLGPDPYGIAEDLLQGLLP